MDGNRVRQLSAVMENCQIYEYLMLKGREDPELDRIRYDMAAIKDKVFECQTNLVFADYMYRGRMLRNTLCGRSRPESIPFEPPAKRNEKTFVQSFQQSSRERCQALVTLDAAAQAEEETRGKKRSGRALKRKYKEE